MQNENKMVNKMINAILTIVKKQQSFYVQTKGNRKKHVKNKRNIKLQFLRTDKRRREEETKENTGDYWRNLKELRNEPERAFSTRNSGIIGKKKTPQC